MRLYDAVSGSKTMLDLRGGHNGAVSDNLMIFTRGLDNFLTRYMPP